MTDLSTLNTEQKLFLSRLLGEEAELGIGMDWAKRLNAMLRHTAAEALDHVLIAGANTMLSRFAAGLRRDFDAINAALELPWTTSPVEGQISRIKMLKRTMYGRAGVRALAWSCSASSLIPSSATAARRVRENPVLSKQP